MGLQCLEKMAVVCSFVNTSHMPTSTHTSFTDLSSQLVLSGFISAWHQ